MIYSLEKLRQSCPDVDLNKAWDETLKQNFVKSKAVDSSFLSSLKKHGVIYTKENHISFPKADSLRYLLDSSRHKKDPRFKKSSLLYALLLLLACWLCLNFQACQFCADKINLISFNQSKKDEQKTKNKKIFCPAKRRKRTYL